MTRSSNPTTIYQDGALTPQEISNLVAEFITSSEEGDISFSLSLGTAPRQIEERLTLYFRPIPGLILRITRFASLLGMAAPVIAAWREEIARADAIGLTISRDFKSLRLYVQDFERHQAEVEKGNLSPFESYQGFKSLPNGQLRHDSYICTPLIPLAQIEPIVRPTLEASEMAAKKVQEFFDLLDPRRLIWAQIHGEARQSWLLTLRELNLPSHKTAALFEDFAPSSPWLKSLLNECQLLHLAGGRDPIKGEFITFYLDARAKDLQKFLKQP